MTEKPEQEGVRKAGWVPPLGKFWTVANVLSLSRAVLVIPITYLVAVDGSMAWIFGLVLLAVLTDFLDGTVARLSHTVSNWGKVLDPLADKFAAAAVTVALVIRGSLPGWFLGLILVRDAVIVLGGVLIARRTGQVVMSIWWGKVAVTALAVTVVAALLKADPPVLQFCIWTTAVLMLYAFAHYVIRFVRLWRSGLTPTAAGFDGEHGRTVASIQPDAS